MLLSPFDRWGNSLRLRSLPRVMPGRCRTSTKPVCFYFLCLLLRDENTWHWSFSELPAFKPVTRAWCWQVFRRGLSRLHREHSWLSNTVCLDVRCWVHLIVIYQVINIEKNIRKISTLLKKKKKYFHFLPLQQSKLSTQLDCLKRF